MEASQPLAKARAQAATLKSRIGLLNTPGLGTIEKEQTRDIR